MAIVELDKIVKQYGIGGPIAVDKVDVTIGDGEFMVLLGPSGCGKSTTLRMIAGLETISSGTLSIDGRLVNDVPAKDRDIAMVFQSYALYPHMSVAENLAFGLRRRKFSSAEIDSRVTAVADILGLSHLLARRPAALSGGQRQRVALGRAMVREPRVFLFDEPLSNLDAALRVNTRSEIIKQHNRLGSTMIYVTHDQVEAMTMGTRICVMNAGRVAQIGAPLEVYWKPANIFVARFLGSPPMNLVTATLSTDARRAQNAELDAPLERWSNAALSSYAGRKITVGVRAEDLSLHRPEQGADAGVMRGRVVAVEPLGAETLLLVTLQSGAEVTARLPRQVAAVIDADVELFFPKDAVYLFDAESGDALPTVEETNRIVGAALQRRAHG
ncbi:sn-glycerol-3-phosphate ABC transporter ATP-binding protein UgpC [Aliihoeflea aestuarii]|jgi:multiple sugar transport system ATP-binding protein|uniref:ABC transporter ATP-binding protein n=1 Tax=Aliihoeflea aestuarii TaxID=453840 RepID=UPI0020929DE0|nr:sn-glycerol-3-phosphate ABC transporter ATP-binding protein UgpC [Aliihoeflea aestuarii]MCO6391832.1 sn-glycerol-3-phosphate ABC transporter ATP-binding protein UgpC [Aliihoeflea aestuarii]